MKRMIQYDQIKAAHMQLTEERAERIAKAREVSRKQRLEELQADEEKAPEDVEREMAEWEEAQDQQEVENDAIEDDSENPSERAMVEDAENALKARRQSDEAIIEEFSAALRGMGVLVVDDVKADVSAEYVFIKLLDKIRDNFVHRRDLIEK